MAGCTASSRVQVSSTAAKMLSGPVIFSTVHPVQIEPGFSDGVLAEGDYSVLPIVCCFYQIHL